LGPLDGVHGVALEDQVHRGHVLGVGVERGGVLDPHREAVLLEERDEQVGGFDGLVPVPAAADDEAGAVGGHRVLSWVVFSGSVLVQLLPSAALVSTAARTRWTCSASSKEGEGSVPSPIAVTRSAIWWVKVCS